MPKLVKNKCCIISYASGEHYQHKIRLLAKLCALKSPQIPFLGFTGKLRYPHEKYPYFFKIELIGRCRRLGYEQVLWVDSVLQPLRDLQPLFDQILEKGYLLIPTGNPWIDWCCDTVLAKLGLDRVENTTQEEWYGGCVGFDFNNPHAVHLFEEWQQYGLQGLFQGARFGKKGIVHRHDQSLLSYAAHRRNQTKHLSDVVLYPPSHFTDNDIPEKAILLSMGGEDFYNFYKSEETYNNIRKYHSLSTKSLAALEHAFDIISRVIHWGVQGDVVLLGIPHAPLIACMFEGLKHTPRKIWIYYSSEESLCDERTSAEDYGENQGLSGEILSPDTAGKTEQILFSTWGLPREKIIFSALQESSHTNVLPPTHHIAVLRMNSAGISRESPLAEGFAKALSPCGILILDLNEPNEKPTIANLSRYFPGSDSLWHEGIHWGVK